MGWAAAVQTNFDGIDIEFWQCPPGNLQNFSCEGLTVFHFKKRRTFRFAQRCVERKNVVLRLVTRIVTDGPVRDDEVRERFAGTPVVVAAP